MALAMSAIEPMRSSPLVYTQHCKVTLVQKGRRSAKERSAKNKTKKLQKPT